MGGKNHHDPSLSSINNSKLKNVVQTFIVSHLCGICRSLKKAKSIVIQVVKNNIHVIELSSMKKRNKKNKLFLGSFRMHYNWCSSHVVPVMEIAALSSSSSATNWTSSSSSSSSSSKNSSNEDEDEARLSGYLHWLEGKAGNVEEDVANEIDRLADMFIADSHEKFRLEKVESYRRFQEMLARSV